MLTVVCLLLSISACKETSARAGFDGDAALRYAQTQVDLGPRVPGTAAAVKAGDWIVSEMRKRADSIYVQQFDYKTSEGASVPMRNIFARFRRHARSDAHFSLFWHRWPPSSGVHRDVHWRVHQRIYRKYRQYRPHC